MCKLLHGVTTSKLLGKIPAMLLLTNNNIVVDLFLVIHNILKNVLKKIIAYGTRGI